MAYARRVHLKRLAIVLAVAFVLWSGDRPVKPQVMTGRDTPQHMSFESPHVHPITVTPDGTRLLAVNTPANSLSVFDLTSGLPRLIDEIPVGLEPVSVAARSDQEAWVTNWLSDSVSVVNLTAGNVVRTIPVGDEPTDVVFAGRQHQLAFVCVSGLSQVKVYDPSAPVAPPHVINIRGKSPRSLSRDLLGGRVFVSVFESGNQTTIVPARKVEDAGGLPKPAIKMSRKLPRAPDTGLIVRWDGSGWADERGDTRWSNFVPYQLADIDMVVIDASGQTPRIASEVRGIGTHIGNSVSVPGADRLYVLNMESHNEIRFEPRLRARFQTSRISTVDFDDSDHKITDFDLNRHINYDLPKGSNKERRLSLALPADVVRGSDGVIYVAATGSARVGVLDEGGAFRGRIDVGQGPTGLALDESRQRLYVLNRFDGSLSIVESATLTQVAQLPLGFNPEPEAVREGRRFLYDASFSAHGNVACASCHLNGHRDGLAWDLGDPKGRTERSGGLIGFTFHPMKGPMTTQSLRGIIGNEPLHWRGDRRTFSDFNSAFRSLLGGSRELTVEEMGKFEAFVQTLAYPPNPLQNLDRTYPDPPAGPNAARGQELFLNSRLDAGLLTCNQCHTMVPALKPGTNNLIIPGLVLAEPQDFKVPQLRGLYQKTGMRMEPGDQLAGYGFIHDGSIDTLLSFLRLPIFTFRNDTDRLDVEAFLLAFDTGVAPAVGLQVTVGEDSQTSPAAVDRVRLLMEQAELGNCELIVKGIYRGSRRGFAYARNGVFQPDSRLDSLVPWEELVRTAAPGAELTFTGVPVGSGRRLGIDQDSDGTPDGDE